MPTFRDKREASACNPRSTFLPCLIQPEHRSKLSQHGLAGWRVTELPIPGSIQGRKACQGAKDDCCIRLGPVLEYVTSKALCFVHVL